MSERERPTRTDILIRKLKNHPVVAVIVVSSIILGGIGTIISQLQKWREAISPQPEVVITASAQEGVACSFSPWAQPLPEFLSSLRPNTAGTGAVKRDRLLVTVNNPSKRARVVTEAFLDPLWLIHYSSVGLAEVSATLDVNLQPWERVRAELPFMPADVKALSEATAVRVNDGTGRPDAQISVPIFVDASQRLWFRPPPIEISSGLRGAYVAEPNLPERIEILLGSERKAFLAGAIRVRTLFDDGTEAISQPVWIEVCGSG